MTAAPTTPPAARAGRLRALDGVRFLAAMAVVAFHFTARDHSRWGELPGDVFPVLATVTRYGYAGVHLFFVVSGFVILMSVWGRSPAQFVASRVSRLYPAYWTGVILTGTLRWLWPTFGTLTLGQVLVNLTMFHEPLGVPSVDGVYWTLWVEMQFYLLMLAFTAIGVTVRRVLVVAAVVPAVMTTIALVWPEAGTSVTFLSWANLFGAGMVLYVIHRAGHTAVRWLLVAFNTAQAAVLAGVQKIGVIDALVTTVGPASGAVLAGIAIACVGTVALVTLVPAVRDVPWAWLTAAGALTYPLYLVHEYVGWALIGVLHPYLGVWPTLAVVTAFVLGLAWLIHRFVEKPTHKPLRRAVEGALTRGREKAPAG